MRKRKLFGILAYLLFLFAVVEIALQTFYYITAGDFLFRRVALPLYQAESFAGYRNRPELSFEHHTNEFRAHYFTNRAGFRVSAPGVEYSVRKPADTYRILILGSSVAYGWGVNHDKSFAALLPRLLEARGFAKGRKIEVINTGVPAMPPAPQLNWYRHVGRKYQPDLVLQFVYGSMAVSGNPASNFVVDDSGHLKATGLSTAQRWRERAKQLATVFYGWVLWTQIDARLSPKPDAQNNAAIGEGKELRQKAFDPNQSNDREVIRFYQRLADTVHNSGARLKIVYFPLSYGVHPQDESRWRHLGLTNVQAQKAYDTAFVRYLNQHGIPSVDITDDLRAAAGQGKRLYYWLDIHWTPEGNAAAAQAVARALEAP